MIDKRKKALQDFEVFLVDFIRDLNQMHEEGWWVLVEGPRDVKALRALGYEGELRTISSVAHGRQGAFAGSRVVILTDLDREGAGLARRYSRVLSHAGVKVSLTERRRLSAASKGVFLHVENLGRFLKEL